MKVSDYTYELPEERIAQFPHEVRGTSRLLVLDKGSGAIEHRKYIDLPDYLNPGDTVVLNDTKVIKARLLATNTSGSPRELLLLEDHHSIEPYRRKALYRGKLNQNEQLTVGGTTVTVEEIYDGGIALISSETLLLELAEHAGTVPLPPYMHREATQKDIERYQTVFAKEPGSVAAPTASLNFTDELQRQLVAKGVNIAYLTLHVGLGTFLPIRTDDVESHKMHSEYFMIPKETVHLLQQTINNSGKIVAVGTTVTRSLEYCADKILNQPAQELSGESDIFMYPGYDFKVVNALLTNFHAPKSTVLMLAAAFAVNPEQYRGANPEQGRWAGWSNLANAYNEAIEKEYAFLSYGDSMLIH